MPDRNGKIFYTSITSLSHISKLNRLKSTRHYGLITELGNGHVDFSVTVQSELELVPWIRGYGSYAVVDSSTNPDLAGKIKTDWEEAMKQYGIIQ